MKKQNFNGERLLLLSVIDTAVEDAISRPKSLRGEGYRASAWKYLASDLYDHHLGLLELPADWLPEFIERAARGEKNVSN